MKSLPLYINEETTSSTLFPENSVTKRIFLNTHGLTMVLNLHDIIYLRSSSNYTIIKMVDGSRHTSCKHLKTYKEAIGSNPDFLRVHRSSIINKNFVLAIFQEGRKTGLLMKDNERLEIAVKKKDWILAELIR